MTINQLAGKQLGQYEVRELIGSGGMSVVYRGYQLSLKRDVAIKVLSLVEDEDSLRRFNREAEIAAKLEHRSIIPVFDYGTQDGISYVVMRLLTGGTLAQQISGRHFVPYPLPEAADLLKQIGSALDYAHSRGAIHRDIKPSNIMFDSDGGAYIVDFGIAKLLEGAGQLTATGRIMGTPLYMPPEQWRTEPAVPASDQYALAVVAYQMVTGRTPFEAPTPHGLMYQHLNETPPTLIHTDVPPAIATVLHKALSKNPQDRYPNITAFAKAFEAAIPSKRQTREISRSDITETALPRYTPPVTAPYMPAPVIPPPHPLPRPRKKTRWWMLALPILIALVGIAAVVILAQKDDDDPESTPTAARTVDPLMANQQTLVAEASAVPTPTPRVESSPEPTEASEVTATPEEPEVIALDGTVLEITQAGSPLNARESPSTNAPIIRRLYWGDRVLWTGERRDGEGYGWYEVRLANGETAYIVDDARFTVERDPAATTSGAVIGVTIQILSDGDGAYVQPEPSVEPDAIKTLHTGDVLEVVGGPVYGEYYLWWNVRTADGQTGWLVDVPNWWVVNE
ncbi:MAG TPA: serine/threonine protein kinase [Aggregatilineaceae bacterium]|nr:serine/threonine protein kinase [Aggregatilineaceae bacterium]